MSKASIDVHAHIAPEVYVSAVTVAANGDPVLEDLVLRNGLFDKESRKPRRELTDIDLRLQQMDEAGVRISTLAVPPPGPAIGGPQLSASTTAKVNEALINIADQYPARFRVLGSLPLPYVSEALAELERIAAHPLVRGIQLMTVGRDWTLDLPELEPVYARAAELGLVIALHPALEPLPSVYEEFSLTASLAPVVSTSLAALRLMLSGLLDRVPDLDVIVPHLGGVIPYLTQRISDLTRSDSALHGVDYYLANRLYLDTCSFHVPAFECAIQTTPWNRILLGSDAPFRGPVLRAVRDVERLPLSAEQRDGILGINAARWFT